MIALRCAALRCAALRVVATCGTQAQAPCRYASAAATIDAAASESAAEGRCTVREWQLHAAPTQVRRRSGALNAAVVNRFGYGALSTA